MSGPVFLFAYQRRLRKEFTVSLIKIELIIPNILNQY